MPAENQYRTLHPAESSMLRAIISGDANGLVEFEQQFSIDDLYPHSIALLGQLSLSQTTLMSEAIQRKISGYQRYVWTRTEMNLQYLREFVRELNAEGIVPMARYELATVLRFQNTTKRRPLYGLDLAVLSAEYAAACRVLEAFNDRNREQKQSHLSEEALNKIPPINIHSELIAPLLGDSLSVSASYKPVPARLSECSLSLPGDGDLLLDNVMRYNRTVGTALWFTDLNMISNGCEATAFVEFENRCHHFLLANAVRSIYSEAALLVKEIGLSPWSPEFDAVWKGLSPRGRECYGMVIRNVRAPFSKIKRSLKNLIGCTLRPR
jgi:hypothetical protein